MLHDDKNDEDDNDDVDFEALDRLGWYEIEGLDDQLKVLGPVKISVLVE